MAVNKENEEQAGQKEEAGRDLSVLPDKFQLVRVDSQVNGDAGSQKGGQDLLLEIEAGFPVHVFQGQVQGIEGDQEAEPGRVPDRELAQVPDQNQGGKGQRQDQEGQKQTPGQFFSLAELGIKDKEQGQEGKAGADEDVGQAVRHFMEAVGPVDKFSD